MLPKSKQFWLGMIVFQLAYGAVIFAATRAYYERDAQPPTSAISPLAGLAAAPDGWRPAVSREVLTSLTTDEVMPDDPVAIFTLAEQHFANKSYAQAAKYYRRLLDFDPGNADIRNNLGLTLQYSGRSTEALTVLGENVAQNPEHQRSWLTLGFVNSQLGDIPAARQALEMAISIDAASDVGRSAQRMLDAL